MAGGWDGNKRQVAREPRTDKVWGPQQANPIALAGVAAVAAQGLELGRGLDTLAHHAHAQAVADVDSQCDDGVVAGIRAEPGDKGLVELFR